MMPTYDGYLSARRVAQLACQAVLGPRGKEHGLQANRATPDWSRPPRPVRCGWRGDMIGA